VPLHTSVAVRCDRAPEAALTVHLRQRVMSHLSPWAD
jgi:hypothetical protein